MLGEHVPRFEPSELERKRTRNRLAQRNYRQSVRERRKHPKQQDQSQGITSSSTPDMLPFNNHPSLTQSQSTSPTLLEWDAALEFAFGDPTSNTNVPSAGMIENQNQRLTSYTVDSHELAEIEGICGQPDPRYPAVGRTALLSAAALGHSRVVDLLLQSGANPLSVDLHGCTILHLAAKYGHEAVVRYALEHSIPVDDVDQAGKTALHYAAEGGFVQIVEILVRAGSEIDAVVMAKS